MFRKIPEIGLPFTCELLSHGKHTALGLDWIGLDWIGLDWIGLDWTGLDWTGLDWIGWIGLDWNEACFVLEHKRKAAVTKSCLLVTINLNVIIRKQKAIVQRRF